MKTQTFKAKDVKSAINLVNTEFGDKAIILSNCKIIAQGTPSELIANNEAKSAYFGDSFQYN